MVFTPTRTVLYLTANPANTASLEALTFHFTAPDGTVYSAVDGDVSAMGTPDEAGFYTYYCQSLFFLEDPAALTLVLEDALWCAKDAAPITVDLNDGSYAGALPAGVTALWVEKNRGDAGGNGGDNHLPDALYQLPGGKRGGNPCCFSAVSAKLTKRTSGGMNTSWRATRGMPSP